MTKESKQLTPREQELLATLLPRLQPGCYREEAISVLKQAKAEGLNYRLIHEAAALVERIPSLEEMGLESDNLPSTQVPDLTLDRMPEPVRTMFLAEYEDPDALWQRLPLWVRERVWESLMNPRDWLNESEESQGEDGGFNSWLVKTSRPH